MRNLFTNIQIQTINQCNRKCEFCPNSSLTLPFGQMQMEYFEKIVDNLGRLNFEGRISPDLNAEPLLERRLTDLIRLIRYCCPQSYIMINSNGDYLDDEILVALFVAGLNCITVNCYDSKKQFAKRIESIRDWKRKFSGFDIQTGIPTDQEYELHPPDYHFVVVRDCSDYSINSDFLTSRAGNVRGKSIKKQLPLNRSCSRPFNQMYINYQGNAILCSEDWRSESMLGNLAGMSLEEIWGNMEYQRYRNHLIQDDRALPICARCDL
ncbi:S-adenosyl-L-methionine-dependent 2-deoxy-scyllo-inosamine dehydrogenase [Candidatus Brocadiaceae bacterium]|nr:S-adenosyl-L-methionine-dependent 2-deoxy-scyllo-inosamine dehydrogenase [Candidatus Brocadiaceae bacterium]